jgi:hypothetical protein
MPYSVETLRHNAPAARLHRLSPGKQQETPTWPLAKASPTTAVTHHSQPTRQHTHRPTPRHLMTCGTGSQLRSSGFTKHTLCRPQCAASCRVADCTTHQHHHTTKHSNPHRGHEPLQRRHAIWCGIILGNSRSTPCCNNYTVWGFRGLQQHQQQQQRPAVLPAPSPAAPTRP